jgi:hypothetical protein
VTKASSQNGSGATSAATTSTVTTMTASTSQYTGKTTICHKLPNGRFNLIAVSNDALPSHKTHGDTLPGAGGTCPGGTIP